MPKNNFIVLGKIVDAHGISGAVRIFPFADDPKTWTQLKTWFLGREGQDFGTWQTIKPIKSKVQSKFIVCELEGISDRNAAEALAEQLIGVPRAALPATAENEYYWGDLIGLTVENTQKISLGLVETLIETPANSVLQVTYVENGKKMERLIPFTNKTILSVDLEAKKIVVEWEQDW